MDEGSSVEVSATGSDPDGDPLTYAWDLDNDGVNYETDGKIASFSAADIDGPATQTIAIRASDPAYLFSTDQATVMINNIALTAKLNADAVSIVENGSITFTFTDQYDPGKADRDAGFSYTRLWDGGTGSGCPGSFTKLQMQLYGQWHVHGNR